MARLGRPFNSRRNARYSRAARGPASRRPRQQRIVRCGLVARAAATRARCLRLLELVRLAGVLAVRDEHRARRVADDALGDAAEEQAAEAAMAVRADRDEVMTATLGRVGDHARWRALDQIDL